jgi:hypothetical protein
VRRLGFSSGGGVAKSAFRAARGSSGIDSLPLCWGVVRAGLGTGYAGTCSREAAGASVVRIKVCDALARRKAPVPDLAVITVGVLVVTSVPLVVAAVVRTLRSKPRQAPREPAPYPRANPVFAVSEHASHIGWYPG